MESPLPALEYEDLVSRLRLPPIVQAVNTFAGLRPRNATDGGSPDPRRVCADGERTHHLTRLAGMWIGQGKSLDQVVELCLEWNAKNTPPLDDNKVVSTVNGIFKTHTRKNGELEQAELTPLFDLEDARVDRLLSTPPPPRRYLLDNLLPLGKVGMVVAPGGTGKSMFALQLGVAVASGQKFLGLWTVPEPGAVLMLFAEDDIEELHNRLHTVADAFCPTQQQRALIGERMFMKSMVAQDNLMTSAQRGGEVTQTCYVDRLLMTARQIPGLRLIVIDPASRFRGGDENTAQDATRFVEQLERLAQETKATVLVLHHANKGSMSAEEQSQAASRGSSAFSDGVRWQANLMVPNKHQAKILGLGDDARTSHLVMSVTKNNYAAPVADTVLMRGNGGILLPSPHHGPKVSLMRRIYDKVKEEADLGRVYTANSFENAFGGTCNDFHVGAVAVRGAIRDAITQGYLLKDKKQLRPGPTVPP